jgi:hypothetical protein
MRIETKTSWGPGTCRSCGEGKESLILVTVRDAAGAGETLGVCDPCLAAAHALVAAFEYWRANYAQRVALDLRARAYPDVAWCGLGSLSRQSSYGVCSHHRTLVALGLADIGPSDPITSVQTVTITALGRLALAAGAAARRRDLEREYACVIDPSDPRCEGETGSLREDKRCSYCGGAGFTYRNGNEFSRDGVRGFRCMRCRTVKPERRAAPEAGA